MVKNLLMKKISRRCAIFMILTTISYFLSIIYLFAFHDIFGSIVCIFTTFILFHFLFIDIKNIKFSYFLIVLLSLFLLEISCIIVFWWTLNIWIILAVFFYNCSFGALFFLLWIVDFNSISYFTKWWFIFTVGITIMYSVAFIWMFRYFPFTCDWLRGATSKLYEFIEKPFVMSLSKWELEESEDIWDIEKEEKSEKIRNNLYNIVDDLNGIDIVMNDDDNMFSPYVNSFYEIKQNSIQQVLSDQSDYSDFVCNALLERINSIFNSDNFKWSVILLSYLLLYWFIRIAFFIMSGIAFIIFKILYRCRVYKIAQTTKKVDDIY